MESSRGRANETDPECPSTNNHKRSTTTSRLLIDLKKYNAQSLLDLIRPNYRPNSTDSLPSSPPNNQTKNLDILPGAKKLADAKNNVDVLWPIESRLFTNEETLSPESFHTPEFNTSILTASIFTDVAGPTPPKHRSKDSYKIVSDNLSESFHALFHMEKIDSKYNNFIKPLIYFFKQHKKNPSEFALNYELEATINSFYKLLVPENCSSSRALNNKKPEERSISHDTIGILSKGIREFKPVRKDPLRKDELDKIEALDHVSIEELDDLDERLQVELKELEERWFNDKTLQSDETARNKLKKQIDNYDLELKSDKKHVIYEIPVKGDDGQILKKVKVTVKDLQNYRAMKSIAKVLTSSIIFEEDDLHPGNWSKKKRVDFDMSLFEDEELSYKYKELNIAEKQLRGPGRFPVAVEDIDDFPNLIKANPFWWPAKESWLHETIIMKLPEWLRKKLEVIPEWLREKIAKNSYKPEDIALYKQLSKSPVFEYHKFVTMLKFILTDEEMYRNRAQLNLHEEFNLTNKIANHLHKRIQLFKTELAKSHRFKAFLQKHGDRAFENILAEFAEQNEKCAKKTDPQLERVNLEKITQEYANICMHMGIEKKTETLMNDLGISQILATDSERFTQSAHLAHSTQSTQSVHPTHSAHLLK